MEHKDSYSGLALFLLGIVLIIPFLIGMYYDLKSVLYVIPIVLVIAVIGCLIYNSKAKSNVKIKSSDVMYFSIGIAVILFVLVFLGSCFHSDNDSQKRYIEQRGNMGLPMY